jgi:hypothetical protein
MTVKFSVRSLKFSHIDGIQINGIGYRLSYGFAGGISTRSIPN